MGKKMAAVNKVWKVSDYLKDTYGQGIEFKRNLNRMIDGSVIGRNCI